MNSSKMYIHLFDGFTIEYGGEVFNICPASLSACWKF